MPRKNTQDWKQLLEEYETTDMTIKKFCEYKGVSAHAFQYHKYGRGQKRKEKKAKVSFTKIEATKPKLLRFEVDGKVIQLDANISEEQLTKIMKGIFS